MLTLWAFLQLTLLAGIIFGFFQFVIPTIFEKIKKKYGLKINYYGILQYGIDYTNKIDKVEKISENKNGLKKFIVNYFTIYPSFPSLNKKWINIEIEDIKLLIEIKNNYETTKKQNGNNIKKNKEKNTKKNKKLPSFISSLQKIIINNILKNDTVQKFLNNIIKDLFSIQIKNINIRIITSSNSIVNYKQENISFYSGLITNTSSTKKNDNTYNEDLRNTLSYFYIKLLISPFAIYNYSLDINKYNNSVMDFSNDLFIENDTSLIHSSILMSEEITEILFKWNKQNKKYFEFDIFINGLTMEYNEIQKLILDLKKKQDSNMEKENINNSLETEDNEVNNLNLNKNGKYTFNV